MKNFLLAMLFLGFIGTISAQQDAKKNGPEMTFEEMVINYGEIAKGSDPYRVFKFTNTGNEPLVIKETKSTCGCTIPEYPKEPIMPGESNEIKVRYDTNRIGTFTKPIKLTTNVSEEQIVLTIKGKILNEEEQKSIPQKEKAIF